jgi:ParB family transcriptional regulator, chromosome partitioning protein
MTTSAAENLAGRGVEKKDEKVEKRRALGRGLESLLPGPRVVSSPESRVPSPEKSVVETAALQEMEASRTEVSDPREHTASAAVATSSVRDFEADDVVPGEVISIQAVAETRMAGSQVAQIAIELIDKNPYQTRYVFDEEMLGELRDSIKEHGVVQPVVVRPAEEAGRYILVLGERRLRASKMAGKATIPALVRRLSPQQAAEMTVLENMVREDLNPIEQAEAFRVLSLEFKLTQAQIADRIGVSRETVSNYMRLLRLPQKVMEYLLADRLSFSDAREILRLENDDYIEQVAEEVVTHKLKWDQIEDRVMRVNGSFPLLPGQTMPGEKRKSGGARWMDPNVRAAQTDMERTLGMRVRIKDRQGKGRIVIEYASVDDYERVTGMLRSGKK